MLSPQPTFWTLEWAEQNLFPIFWTPVCGSTQDIAKEDFVHKKFPEKLYLTGEQLHGRGRKADRKWVSNKDTIQFLSTWCFQISRPSPLLPVRVGMALFDALSIFPQHSQISLKAPNDIYMGSYKIAGLLTEIVQQGNDCFAFIGLGLNVAGLPPVPQSASLFEKQPAGLGVAQWNLFLTRWHSLLSDATKISSTLTDIEKENLLMALNRHPLLVEKVVDIDYDGSLICPSGTISWRNL